METNSKTHIEAVKACPGTTEKVEFNYNWCKRCGICVTFCPRGALDLDRSNGMRPWLANPTQCTCCGLCQVLCPDFAIQVFKTPSRGGKK